MTKNKRKLVLKPIYSSTVDIIIILMWSMAADISFKIAEVRNAFSELFWHIVLFVPVVWCNHHYSYRLKCVLKPKTSVASSIPCPFCVCGVLFFISFSSILWPVWSLTWERLTRRSQSLHVQRYTRLLLLTTNIVILINIYIIRMYHTRC